jgi:hypothetical protein
MSDLTPSGRRLPRKQREQRAFRLVVAGGASAVAAVVALFVSGFGLFLVLALVAAACAYGFKRTVA